MKINITERLRNQRSKGYTCNYGKLRSSMGVKGLNSEERRDEREERRQQSGVGKWDTKIG